MDALIVFLLIYLLAKADLANEKEYWDKAKRILKF